MESMLMLQLVLVAVVIVALVAGFTLLGVLVYRTAEQSRALGAASILQGREIKQLLAEVKEELARGI
jgi:uncharacterized membrane protein YqiK